MFARISRIVLVGFLLMVLGELPQTTIAQTPEENKAIARSGVEAIWNQGNLDVADEIFHVDFVSHDPNWPWVVDRESYKQYQDGGRGFDPGQYTTIDDMIAEGDKVAYRVTWHGTEPSNHAAVQMMAIFRIADGVIVESWWSKDYLGFVQQLGVIPPLVTAVEHSTWGQIKSLFQE